jgi:hypothetical protein
MTLREIARVSAAEGLTAQEASKKYGINMYSLRKTICRHRMPQLITERERGIETQFKNMTDAQILNYKSILELPKNKDVGATERQMLSNELARRNIK